MGGLLENKACKKRERKARKRTSRICVGVLSLLLSRAAVLPHYSKAQASIALLSSPTPAHHIAVIV